MVDSRGVVGQLLAAAPSIAPAWQEHVAWWEGEEPGSYNDIEVVARHVVDHVRRGQLDEVNAVFAVVESLLGQDLELDVVTLLRFGLIEDIQNIAGWEDDAVAATVRALLGPLSGQLWDEVDAYRAGRDP